MRPPESERAAATAAAVHRSADSRGVRPPQPSGGSGGTESGTRETAYRACARLALLSGVFSLIVSGLLLLNWAGGRANDPSASVAITALKAELAKRPEDEALKARIRRLDREVREEYFRRKAFAARGNLLLAGGLIFFLASLEGARRLRRRLPLPGPAREDAWSAAGRSRLAAAGLGALACLGLVALGAGRRGDVALDYMKAVGVTGERERKSRAASEKEIAANWPQFRGPGSAGRTDLARPPEHWDGAKGENILWKTPVPLPGENSPVVWGDRVFLCGADETRREVYCFAAGNGKLLWKQAVGSAGGEVPNVFPDTGFAAPTMATDGQRVFALFASGHIAGFDFEGNLRWIRNLGVPVNMYGHAASPVVWRDRLIVQYDQGSAPEEGKSALLALDVATGETKWETKRPVPNSWSTPIVIKTAEGEEIITCANPFVIAYDPATGAERWRAECLAGDVAPTPIYAGGFVFACNIGAALCAIRPGGEGNVTESAIAWRAMDGMPDTASPASDGEMVFLVTSDGMVTCYDARDGTKVWEHYLEAQFRSSPTVVGKRLYVMDTEGVMHVLEVGRAFREVATAPLGEPANSSPAFVGGRVYIRGKQNLYCIGR